jgi:hypothetical protein
MVHAVAGKIGWLLGGFFCAGALVLAQEPVSAPLSASGQIVVAGRSTPYLIHHLPLSSYPGLPGELVVQLNRRGCLIPQSFEAHHPENVIHASLERAGSSDWALLCSAEGRVSLLVYFSSAPASLLVLSSAAETDRLQAHDPSGVLGFNWGIDPATPEQIRQAQSGLANRPPLVDHDALVDSLLDGRTVYRFYRKSAWTVLEMPSN